MRGSSSAGAAWAVVGLLLCLLGPACGDRQAGGGFALEDGDLLFQDLDGSPLCDAIEAVTQGCSGAKFSHVGIVALAEDGRPTVIEAYGKVTVTPLAKFLARSRDEKGRPKVVVGRLAGPYRKSLPSALQRARGLVGEPYDDVFLIDNGKYYCSELVYESYLAPATGRHLFRLFPMTFRRPGSGQPMPTWVKYYAAKPVAIPQGKPGCNPGGISRSEKVRIVHAFGRPAGWSEEVYRRYAGPGAAAR